MAGVAAIRLATLAGKQKLKDVGASGNPAYYSLNPAMPSGLDDPMLSGIKLHATEQGWPTAWQEVFGD